MSVAFGTYVWKDADPEKALVDFHGRPRQQGEFVRFRGPLRERLGQRLVHQFDVDYGFVIDEVVPGVEADGRVLRKEPQHDLDEPPRGGVVSGLRDGRFAVDLHRFDADRLGEEVVEDVAEEDAEVLEERPGHLQFGRIGQGASPGRESTRRF